MPMATCKHFFAAGNLMLGVLCALTACDESNDDGPKPAPVEVQGLWLGTVTYPFFGGAQGPARLIVDPNGNAYLVPLSANLEPAGLEHQGSLQNSNDAVSGNLWRSSTGLPQNVDVNGVLAPRWSMDLDCTGSGVLAGAHMALDFDSTYDHDSSIGLVGGNWHVGGVSLTIDATGQIQGSDLGGGIYEGSIHAPWPRVNVYTISIDAYEPGAAFPYAYDGVATLLDRTATADTLLITMIGFSSFFAPTLYWSPQLAR